MNFRVFFSLLLINALAACSGTTVVLVPDANGKTGQVDVITKAGTTRLSKANESAKAAKADQAPSQPESLSESTIQDMFGATLSKEPKPPEHFRFHFASGSTDILPEDNQQLALTKSAIVARNSCDISIIGHSDTVGDNSVNKGISLARAKTVANALINLGVAKNCMEDLRYYGENDPVVRTADNIDEPLNRRVEVEIR